MQKVDSYSIILFSMSQLPESTLIDVNVRVNPGNVELTLDNYEYVAAYRKELGVRATLYYLQDIQQALDSGEMEPPTDDEELETLFMNPPKESWDIYLGNSPTTSPVRRAIRHMQLRSALGGYGLAGKVDNKVFEGMNIHYILDETVPLGGHEVISREDLREL